MPEPNDPARIEEIRQQLRSLGYLDARVDRFVLGGAASRRPVGLALTASLRIGALTGLLLGPAAAIGLRAYAPGLVTSAGDAVMVAAYLAVLFGAAAVIVSSVAILFAGAIARRAAGRPDFSRQARRAASAAGLIVGLTSLVYLTLWWRTTVTLEGLPSWTWTAIALVVAVTTSLLIGHVVVVTVLAVVARAGRADALTPGLPLAGWRVTLPAGVIAFAGAVTLLLATVPPAHEPPVAPSLTVVPTGMRVVAIAIDGVDAPILDSLRSAGRLPVLHRLLQGGVATMPSDPDRDPAQVWTSIATGQPPARHGVRALEGRQVAGVAGRLERHAWLTGVTDLLRLTRPVVASGDDRVRPTFWEVAARAGLRTAVVHWWATWPATGDGLVLTDRAVLRLEHGGPLSGEIAPATLYATLRERWPAIRDRAGNLARRAVPDGSATETRSVLARSAALDASLVELFRELRPEAHDLSVLYFPGLDIAQHALFGASDEATRSAGAAAERVTAIERYYEFLDSALGSIFPARGSDDALIVVITQPGRVAQPVDGLLAVSGAGTGGASGPLSPHAVAPTVLYALGVPIAEDLTVTPALGLFDRAFTERHPVRSVTTYGLRRANTARATGQPLDREMIERMRSLGYLR